MGVLCVGMEETAKPPRVAHVLQVEPPRKTDQEPVECSRLSSSVFLSFFFVLPLRLWVPCSRVEPVWGKTPTPDRPLAAHGCARQESLGWQRMSNLGPAHAAGYPPHPPPPPHKKQCINATNDKKDNATNNNAPSSWSFEKQNPFCYCYWFLFSFSSPPMVRVGATMRDEFKSTFKSTDGGY